jgi:fibronectin type 3 domain-containing protein
MGEMMKNRSLVRSMLVMGAVLTGATLACGQDTSGQADQKSAARQQKAASKPHKVWTDEDLGSIHRSSVVSVAQAHPESAMPTPQGGTDAPPAAEGKRTIENKSALKAGPDVLAHPKTTDDADKMIAWEQRDIDSQQEYVDQVQEQLDKAPADQKARLQKVLAERQQILADVRREQQQLIAEKKLLQKKSAGDSSASTQSPQ